MKKAVSYPALKNSVENHFLSNVKIVCNKTLAPRAISAGWENSLGE